MDLIESCEDCGFVWETGTPDDVGPRALAGVAAIGQLLAADHRAVTARPAPTRWSMIEYAAHVRDVLITIRERTVSGLVEDNPGFGGMHREERVDMGLYRGDTIDAVTLELAAAAAMYVRLFDAIDPAHLARPVQYGFPDPTERTLAWMGQQAIHETEHHLADIAENARLIAAGV